MATQAARKQRRNKASVTYPRYVPIRNHPGPGRHPLAMPLYRGMLLPELPSLTPDQYVRLRDREVARLQRRKDRGPTKRQRKLDAHRAQRENA